VPAGGTNTVCSPAIVDSDPPPLIVHVIGSSLLVSVALKSVGAVTLSGPPDPFGEIVNAGPLSDPPHAPSTAIT
jgi:hypothetical protein